MWGACTIVGGMEHCEACQARTWHGRLSQDVFSHSQLPQVIHSLAARPHSAQVQSNLARVIQCAVESSWTQRDLTPWLRTSAYHLRNTTLYYAILCPFEELCLGFPTHSFYVGTLNTTLERTSDSLHNRRRDLALSLFSLSAISGAIKVLVFFFKHTFLPKHRL